jgi:hypothetical protein
MRTKAKRRETLRTTRAGRKQVNIRLEPALYQTLESIARHERRSVPQTARQLIEAGVRQHVGGRARGDDIASQEIAALAMAGGAFDWLADEPDLYDDTCGEPL